MTRPDAHISTSKRTTQSTGGCAGGVFMRRFYAENLMNLIGGAGP